ncbi:MAG: hypothetical protein K9M45_08195 [Kiritimatiellales bacterium]|nr:hypothetical protein [Kiritimatiellales bacterium]
MKAIAAFFILLAVGPVLCAAPIPIAHNSRKVDVADLYHIHRLGKAMALEESQQKLGLFLRPKTESGYADYDWLVKKNGTISFHLAFKGHAGISRLAVAVHDWNGTPVFKRVYNASSLDETLSFTVNSYGIWMISFDAYSGDAPDTIKSRLIRSFGAIPDANSKRGLWKQKNEYILGSCFFPSRYHRWGKDWTWKIPPFTPLEPEQGIDKIIKMSAGCGFTVLRCDTFNYHAGRGWSAKWDLLKEIGKQYQAHGMAIDLKYNLNPMVFQGSTLNEDPERMHKWKDDLDVLIGEFVVNKPIPIGMIEFGNEPAHHAFWAGTREQYQQLFSYAQQKVAAADPDLLTVHGATCPPGADLAGEKRADPDEYERMKKEQEEWYKAFYKACAEGGTPWAYHWHGTIKPVALEWRKWEKELLEKQGVAHSNYIQTEGGACAWRPAAEFTCWTEVMQKILYSISRREKGWLQYDAAYSAAPSRYLDSQGWSIIHAHVMAPKFQYGSMAGMVWMLAGNPFEKMLYEKDPMAFPRIVMQHAHPKGKLLVYYAVENGEQLKVTSDGTACAFIDSMGNVTRRVKGGNARIKLSTAPRYLLLEGAEKVRVK